MLDDLESAAALHAGALLLADHVHRNHDLDRLALARGAGSRCREVLDRVELVVARDGADRLAVHVDLEDRGQEVTGEDQLLGLVEVEGDRLGRLAGSVDDGGNLALATNGRRPPLPARSRATALTFALLRSWSWSLIGMENRWPPQKPRL